MNDVFTRKKKNHDCGLSHQKFCRKLGFTLEHSFEGLTLTLMFSLAEVSKNSKPSESANCLPRSKEITLSSSMSHLFPTRITCALSQEYVLICVHLKFERKKLEYYCSATVYKFKILISRNIIQQSGVGNSE